MTELTWTHLRFELIAETPLHLGGPYAGQRLRDALARVMLHATCPATPRGRKPDPQHAAVCPVCWLLAAETDPGQVSRVYSLAPPLRPPERVQPGETFSFTLTLFGEAGLRFLPYFVLAAPEAGQTGLGPGRGRFTMRSITAVDPLGGRSWAVLAPGDYVVHIPPEGPGWEQAEAAAGRLYAALAEGGHGAAGDLTVHFLSPTRLIEGGALMKSPDFGVFFRRLLERIDTLRRQILDAGRRPAEEVDALYGLADRVRLVESEARWIDLKSYSGRRGESTPMGGFAGQARYRAAEWGPLLPWLVLGQAVQAGKLAVKGHGVFQIEHPALEPYWSSIYSAG